MSGRLEAIGLAVAAGEPLRAVGSAEAIAGRGLEGDRYATEAGKYSDQSSGERDITLIATEALAAMQADTGIPFDHLDSRRNLLVGGIDLNALVGCRFRVGAVECIGNELAEPCTYLEGLTEAGVLAGLVHRGGLRAGITSGGLLAVGDVVEPLD